MKVVLAYGDALETLQSLPTASVNLVVTSPPYWALRTYHVEGQLGQEPTVKEYVDKLTSVFGEVKRVLRDDGVCFVNLGDTYGGTGDKGSFTDPKYREGRNGQAEAINKSATAKSLCQIPNRFAIAMTDNGWLLRNKIIWHKPNQMPSSAKDRFTVDYEEVFMFTKQKKYFFQQQLEPYTAPMNRWGGEKLKANGESSWDEGTEQTTYRDREMRPNAEGRNKRCVWSINTKPYSAAHFATYPEALVEPMIKAGCPKGGVVLDPFNGAGTTGIVAIKQGCEYFGIDLNMEYLDLAASRIVQECPEAEVEWYI